MVNGMHGGRCDLAADLPANLAVGERDKLARLSRVQPVTYLPTRKAASFAHSGAACVMPVHAAGACGRCNPAGAIRPAQSGNCKCRE
ncbi:hypothetical protein BX592_12112 [Paraburkholderia rhizosphaerae]|uniref:Uncharacterized protein n=1 Tax=Paraburkholderia rhizosphaerae TaxID=480658 RepID=A0A4R8LGZ3_9BURK|nr:hypothetical protein BX592_12112 [Paraburkholderia rhizosphaerae]